MAFEELATIGKVMIKKQIVWRGGSKPKGIRGKGSRNGRSHKTKKKKMKGKDEVGQSKVLAQEMTLSLVAKSKGGTEAKRRFVN